MRIAIGGDHAGFDYKKNLIIALTEQRHSVTDVGPFSSESCDFPDFAHPVAESVASKTTDMGILLCGSGNGVCMTANKHEGIRAALCWETELAVLARQHNNANILCIPARFVSFKLALQMAELFLSTPFEGGRHERRVSKIDHL